MNHGGGRVAHFVQIIAEERGRDDCVDAVSQGEFAFRMYAGYVTEDF